MYWLIFQPIPFFVYIHSHSNSEQKHPQNSSTRNPVKRHRAAAGTCRPHHRRPHRRRRDNRCGFGGRNDVQPYILELRISAQIDCHGGVLAVKKVLEAVLNAGARAADPGEFTKRAFLNGRMDLTQAEAVMDVISAKSAYALKSSESQLRGTVKKAIRAIREKLIYEIAFIESALDDPEHISLDGYPERLAVVVAEQKKQVEKLLASADEGKMIQEGS